MGDKSGRRLDRRARFRAPHVVGVLFVLVGVLIASVASAHTRRRSYSHLSVHADTVAVEVRLDLKNVAELLVGPGLERGSVGLGGRTRLQQVAAGLVGDGIRLSQAGEPCTLAVDQVYEERRQLVVEGEGVCASEIESVSVEVDMFDAAPMDHTHFMRVSFGKNVHEAVFTRSSHRVEFSRSGAIRNDSLGWVVVSGIVHVLSGADHVAFVLTLLCVTWYLRRAQRGWLREVMGLALAFTVGHSLTLALATLDVVKPDESSVEWLIAFSVAGVAIDGLLRVHSRRRWEVPVIGVVGISVAALTGAALLGLLALQPLAVLGGGIFLVALMGQRDPGPAVRVSTALAFGLVHGFGFASALSEGGFDGQSALILLFLFNLGVEVGQLVVIGLAISALALAKARVRDALVVDLVCGAVLSLGCYWLALRS